MKIIIKTFPPASPPPPSLVVSLKSVVRNGLLGGLVTQDSEFHVMAASSDLSCVHENNYPLTAVE